MAKRKSKKKQNNTRTYFSIAAFFVIVLLFIAIFQLGIVGEFIDSIFAYIFGTSRYFTYIILFLISIYLATELKFPFTKRTFGYLLLQLGLLFMFHSILYAINQERIENFYTFHEVRDVIHENGILHFFGGGIIGQLLFSFSSLGVSLIGTILLAIIFMYFAILVLLNKDIGNTLSHHLNTTFKYLVQILTWIVNGLKKIFNHLFNFTKAKANEFKTNREHKKRLTNIESEPKQNKGSKKKEAVKEENFQTSSSNEKQNPIIESVDDDFDETNESYDNSKSQRMNNEESHHNNGDNDTSDVIVNTENDPQEIEYESENETEDHMYTHDTNESVESSVEAMDDEEFDQIKAYELPSLTMLNDALRNEKVSNEEVLDQGKLLEETLENFGVNAKVSKIRIGPAVTQFEIQPDVGVKVSKIINLQNDIALSLAAKDIRIEAPIPGKSAVGIEVPNSVVSMVTLREVLKRKTSKNPLDVALGKDISGAPITAELNKMPHLLVAGSTGSGKSVCINGIIISLLMNAKPHEVKLMMIDPKMVELNVYNGIPHLLSPVVTNPQKASDALNKIVSEMERRYDLFSHSNTRNIEAYNQYLERESDDPEKVQKLPYIVVIIDELADLMMVASKEVEASITRIAQMARAAGIHLIIATQRPSVDVITGIIKANIPSRIAFSVSSQTDSRTIIDAQGAEKLLGRGDMLFLPSGRSKPIRVQGAFLSDDEVSDVVEHITSQMKANYETFMAKPVEDKKTTESEDELYPDAKWFVIDEQRASASLLQRQFKIGYNRAARLVDELEANGVIGPQNGSKPRNVLMEREE